MNSKITFLSIGNAASTDKLLTRRASLKRIGLAATGLGLASSGIVTGGAPVAPRETLPNFTLPHVRGGKAFELRKARGRFVALHFLLKTECPICLRHTRTYLQRANELNGVDQIFIKPDSLEDIEKWTRDMPKDAPIYRDADAALAKKLGIPDGYSFHGQTVHFPALILVDPEGREVFRYIGKNNGDRVSFDQLAEKVKAARSNR